MLNRMLKLCAGITMLVALSGFGLAAGGAARAALGPDPVVQAVCEDDECELGIGCVNNAGGNTGCDVNSSGGCRTYGCAGIKT